MRILLLILLVFITGACASGARTGAMVAPFSAERNITENHPARNSVAMGEVSGGKKTNPLWTSEIANADFKSALEQSLSLHALLAQSEGKYRLDVNLEKLDQPLVGFSMKVKSDVRYTLTDLSDNAVVFDEIIHSEYTAAFGDSFFGAKRLQLANEGVIRNSIEAIISRLIKLSDDGEDITLNSIDVMH
jgi:hypothetical protein